MPEYMSGEGLKAGGGGPPRLTFPGILAQVWVLFIAALPCLGCGTAPPPRLEVGDLAPSFSLRTLDDTRLDSSALHGRVTVLNFWATWCQPCLAEIPELSALAASGRAEVVGIALDSEGAAALRPFIAEQGIEYTVLLGDQDLFTSFNGFSIPYTLVLDAAWRVVNLYRGPATLVELERDLDALSAVAAGA